MDDCFRHRQRRVGQPQDVLCQFDIETAIYRGDGLEVTHETLLEQVQIGDAGSEDWLKVTKRDRRRFRVFDAGKPIGEPEVEVHPTRILAELHRV